MVRMFMAEKGFEVPKVEVDLRGGENRREPFRSSTRPPVSALETRRRYRAGRDHGDLRVHRRDQEGHAVADRRHSGRAGQHPYVGAPHRPQHPRAGGPMASVSRRASSSFRTAYTAFLKLPTGSRKPRGEAGLARRTDGLEALRHGNKLTMADILLSPSWNSWARSASRSIRRTEYRGLDGTHEGPAERRG